MFELIVVIIAAYGITNIVTQGTIFDPIKEMLRGCRVIGEKLFYLLNCPMCFGFWVGLFLGLLFGPFEWWNIIMNGAFYSATTWLIHCLAAFLGMGQDPERNINLYFPNNVPLYDFKKDINNKEVLNEEHKESDK